MTPKRLLIVDDEPDVLRLLERSVPMIRAAIPGLVADLAGDSRTARERLAENTYDLIVSDEIGIGGRELACEAERLGRIPKGSALIASAHTGSEFVSAVHALGFEFIGKPFQPRAFAETVIRLLRRGDA
jgi:DNA-binding NtrC family response regulator